jgi:hypothetical protein
MGDLRGVNAQEPKAELGLVRGDGDDGITIADAPDDRGESAKPA